MTVQDLINKLKECDNRQKEVVLYDETGNDYAITDFAGDDKEFSIKFEVVEITDDSKRTNSEAGEVEPE